MKKRAALIIGIIIIIIGAGIFLYPIIRQAYTAHQQKLLMAEFREQIMTSINEVNSETQDAINSGTVASTVEYDNFVNEDDDAEDDEENTASGIGTGVEISLDNITEAEVTEETGFNKSRLSGQHCIGIITIQSINLVYAIVEGTDDDNIGVAIGHFTGSAEIGAEGNCALAGHNGGTYGRYFGDIKKLKNGDEVVMTNLKGYEYTYKVIDSFVVDPTDIYVVQPLEDEGKFLTMITCTEHGTKRLVVRAKCTTDPVLMKGE